MRKRQNVSMIESRDKTQSDVWDFPVRQEELLTSEGIKSGIHAVVRGDNGAVIGQYKGEKVLPYPSLVETFEESLSTTGFEFTRSIVTTGNGARFFGRYAIGQTQVGNESFGDILRLQSSHDGKLTPGFAYEAERLACFNGMVMRQVLWAMFRKHSANLDLGFIAQNMTQAIENGRAGLSNIIGKLANIQIDDGQARNVLSNIVEMGATKGVSPRAGYLINDNWENPSEDEKPLGNTLYRLYNASTRFCRDVETVGRFELSRKANQFITGAFTLAGERKHDLDRLLSEPRNALDFDGVTVNN